MRRGRLAMSLSMNRPPEIELLPDGSYRVAGQTSLAQRILRIAVIVAVLGGMVALAGLVLWATLLLIPVVLGAAVVAWLAWRFELWRRR